MKLSDGVKYLMSISGKQLNYLVDKGYVEYNPSSKRYRLTSKGRRLREKIAEGKIEKRFPFWNDLVKRKIRLGEK